MKGNLMVHFNKWTAFGNEALIVTSNFKCAVVTERPGFLRKQCTSIECTRGDFLSRCDVLA